MLFIGWQCGSCLLVTLQLRVDIQEAPAIVESHYDERIVGCSGGVGGKFLWMIFFGYNTYTRNTLLQCKRQNKELVAKYFLLQNL